MPQGLKDTKKVNKAEKIEISKENERNQVSRPLAKLQSLLGQVRRARKTNNFDQSSQKTVFRTDKL